MSSVPPAIDRHESASVSSKPTRRIPDVAIFHHRITPLCRVFLVIPYKAGELVRAVDDSVITEDRVHEASEKREQSQIEHGMRELTQHGHLSLAATLHLALEGDTPARVRDIFPRYRTIAERSDIDPLVRRRMHDHLADLAMLGILDRQSRNEGRAGGRYYEYEFSVALELVREVVGDLDGVALPRPIARQL